MTEKISVITISYNSEKTIEKTFQSVLAQTYRPLEYVLVDGESKDGTISLIKRYIPRFEAAGIEVNFKTEPDMGISDAFNKGITRSTGDIIGIINSDDLLLENALNFIISEFDRLTEVVCGDCLWIDEKREIQYIRKSKMNLNKLKFDMVLMHPTCFVRKDAYEKYGKFDVNLKYVMDKDLMSRFYRKGAKFKYTPHVITAMSSGGASDVNANKVFDEGVIVAVRNGVPKWKAILKNDYKRVRLCVVNIIKSTCIFQHRRKGNA